MGMDEGEERMKTGGEEVEVTAGWQCGKGRWRLDASLHLSSRTTTDAEQSTSKSLQRTWLSVWRGRRCIYSEEVLGGGMLSSSGCLRA